MHTYTITVTRDQPGPEFPIRPAPKKQSIEHKTELYICQKLRACIPDLLFVPESGGDEDTGKSTIIEPPFVVVMVKHAEKVLSYLPVYEIEGAVRSVFHTNETTSGDQSRMRRRIWEALDVIAANDDNKDIFTLSGLDVSGVASETDNRRRARVGDIEFTCGASD